MAASRNPLLRRLGFGEAERVVLIHADDLGMCPSTVLAFEDLLAARLVSTGSAMVPAPAFSEVTAFCRRHPAADVGVHLTLTCEWETSRWGAVSTDDRATGLLAADGGFPSRSATVAEAGDAAAVRREIDAQVDLARGAGIEVTHADSHMLALLAPRLLPVYREAAERWGLPVPLLAPAGDFSPLPPAGEAFGLLGRSARWPAVCDHWVTLRLRWPEDRIAQAKRLFATLPAGLTQLSIHPALDTPDLRAIASDWRCRVADWEAFRSAELREHVERAGIRVIGYRAVRDAAAV